MRRYLFVLACGLVLGLLIGRALAPRPPDPWPTSVAARVEEIAATARAAGWQVEAHRLPPVDGPSGRVWVVLWQAERGDLGRIWVPLAIEVDAGGSIRAEY